MKLSLHCPEIKRQIYPEIKFTVGVRHYYAQTCEMSNIYGKGFESRLLNRDLVKILVFKQFIKKFFYTI
jgi:hypothetical protein